MKCEMKCIELNVKLLVLKFMSDGQIFWLRQKSTKTNALTELSITSVDTHPIVRIQATFVILSRY